MTSDVLEGEVLGVHFTLDNPTIRDVVRTLLKFDQDMRFGAPTPSVWLFTEQPYTIDFGNGATEAGAFLNLGVQHL